MEEGPVSGVSQILYRPFVLALGLIGVRGVIACSLPFVLFLLPNAYANGFQNKVAQLVSNIGKAAPFEHKVLLDKGRILSAGLKRYSWSIGLDIKNIREHGISPGLLLSSLPSDLQRIDSPKLRKVLFIQAALPLILEVNQKLLSDRSKIKSTFKEKSRGIILDASKKKWLETIQKNYGLTDLGQQYNAAFFDAMLKRVDIVPVSMALAQSAEESGWGTSRFAHEGNALFGQRVWRSATGMIPRLRPRGEKFLVRSFNNLLESVWAYALNLNTHPAYIDFRVARRNLRLAGEDVVGLKLIGKLGNYSEKGEEYVRKIENIIKLNQLEQFDGARQLNSNQSPVPF